MAFLPKDRVVVMENRNNEVEDLITVSVVTFNHAPYIKQCIDSILGQTWQNLEILVVDVGFAAYQRGQPVAAQWVWL